VKSTKDEQKPTLTNITIKITTNIWDPIQIDKYGVINIRPWMR